jgi:glycosyltransferase involved in cell wall biosynthesis
MRVVHVMASRANGGAETYSADMIASLAAAGLEQVAVVPDLTPQHAKLAAAGVPMASDVLQPALGFLRRRRLLGLIQSFAPDLVHCWMRRAASLVPGLEVPVIGWFGGYYEPAKFKSCSHFVGVTPDIVRHMIAEGVAPGRAFFVPTFPSIESAPALDRASLQTPPDAVVLLTLSRLHEKKGLDIFLQSLVDLPRCVAWLAGDGPLENDLKALAASLGVADRVRFLGWRTDRGSLLRAADICVLPSRWEPFGTVMLEAWAAGTPLVAAASQGPSAFVRDGGNGLLVPPDDAAALGAAICRLIEDPSLKSSLIAGGRADYEKDFTQPAVTQRMIAVYRRLIADRTAGADTAMGNRT